MKIEELYQPIGKMVVDFQFLELMVNGLLLELTRQDFDTGLCVTSEMSFNRLVAALIAVSKVRVADPKLLQDVEDCAVRLMCCEQNRNTILHSNYSEHADGLIRLKITAKQKKGLNKMFWDVSAKEIEKQIDYIHQTNKQLNLLVKKFYVQGLISNRFFRDAAKPSVNSITDCK